MRTRTAQVTLTIICFVFGVMLVTQFRTQTKIQRSVLTEPATNQATLISNLYDSNLSLRRELVALDGQLDQYERSPGRNELTSMAEELNRMRVVTGAAEVQGSGVEVRASAPLTREDLQDLVNELRNAGAEALALNGQRIVAQTAVTGDQRALYVNDVLIQGPYVFRAIGHAETVERALVRKGGVLAIVENLYPEGSFGVSKMSEVTLPAYKQDLRWNYAKPFEK